MVWSLAAWERTVYTLTMPSRGCQGGKVQTDGFPPVTVTTMYQTRDDDPELGRYSVLWPDPLSGPWWISFRWAVTAGRIECVGVEARSCREENEDWPPELPSWSDEPPALTWDVWRSLPVPTMVRDLRQGLANLDAQWWRAWADDPTLSADQDGRWRRRAAEAEARVAGPTALPLSVYDEVARVYVAAWKAGKAPTQAVAKHFTISASAAAKRVMRARQTGALPPTTRGKGGAEPASRS